MRKLVMTLLLAGLAGSLAGGGRLVLVEHNHGAEELACAGDQTGGKCDLVWMNYSIESRYKDRKKVNCPSKPPTEENPNPRCYEKWTDTKKTSSAWGTPATKELVGPEYVPEAGLTFSGVYYGQGSQDVRIWTGLRVVKAGDGSVAVGAGRNVSNDPYLCVTAYGRDRTDGHQISKFLYDQGISDDRYDYDTDFQVCGELLRSLL